MTLHEAIASLLSEKKRPMSTDEIAKEINIRKSYLKKDYSLISPYQIHGRTKNYPNLFLKSGNLISLINSPVSSKIKTELEHSSIGQNFDLNRTPIEFEKKLFDITNFVTAPYADNLIPKGITGFYCIRINSIEKIPEPFSKMLSNRNHNILYIGLATKCLHTRFVNQELRAKGHGTFFRSIGAILGFFPLVGSLTSKVNKRNYNFSVNDQQNIINWINNNLIINWVEFTGNFEREETRLILKYQPLLNLSKNPLALSELINLRANCVKIANNS